MIYLPTIGTKEMIQAQFSTLKRKAPKILPIGLLKRLRLHGVKKLMICNFHRIETQTTQKQMKKVIALIHATLANFPLSPITLAVMDWRKGATLPVVTWASEVKPAAAHKSVKLSKQVSVVLKAGIAYENMKANEGRETGPLPWGEWENLNYTIAHKGARYVRFTPSHKPEHKPKTRFFTMDCEVSRKEFASFLTPSDAAKLFSSEVPTCFNVKEANLIGLGEIEA